MAAAVEDVAVHVSVRVRPLNEREPQSAWYFDAASLSCTEEKYNSRSWSFGEGRVYVPGSSTKGVYEEVAKPIVKKALEGYHGYIFAYGQTSSGKTYTMLGNGIEPGIIPLSLHDVFTHATEHQVIRVSYLEIYNEQVRDLLDPKKGILDVFLDEKRVPMIFVGRLMGTTHGGPKVEATTTVVQNVDEALDVIKRGEANRHYGVTRMNTGSSRSHTIFRMEISSRDPRRKTLRSSELFLVDLAGMESIKKSGVTGSGAEEAGRINKSLLVLEKVVRCLDEASRGNGASLRNAALITRESKLTRFLKPALGGNSRTAIICTVTPGSQHISETITTLDFAARAMNIRNRARVNEVQASMEKETQLVREYKEQVDDFRSQLIAAEMRVRELMNEKEALEAQQLALLASTGKSEATEAERELARRQSLRNSELESQLQAEERLRRDLDMKIMSLESILNPEREKRKQAEMEKEQALRELEEHAQARQTNEATIQQLQQLVRRLQQDAGEKGVQEIKLRDRVDALELSLDEASDALSATLSAQADLKKTIEDKENTIAELSQKIRFMESSLSETERALGEQRLATSKHMFAHMDPSQSQLAAERDTLEMECISAKKRAEEAEKHMDEAVAQQIRLQTRVTELQEYSSRLGLQLDEALRKIQQLKGRTGSEEVTQLRLSDASRAVQLQSYEQFQSDQQQQLVLLRLDKLTLQQQMEQIRDEKASFAVRDEEHRKEVEGLRAQIAEMREQALTQKHELQTLAESFKQRSINLEREISSQQDRHSQTAATLRVERDKLQERVNALQVELQEANIKLELKGEDSFMPGPRLPASTVASLTKPLRPPMEAALAAKKVLESAGSHNSESSHASRAADAVKTMLPTLSTRIQPGGKSSHVMRELMRIQAEQEAQRAQALADGDVDAMGAAGPAPEDMLRVALGSLPALPKARTPGSGDRGTAA